MWEWVLDWVAVTALTQLVTVTAMLKKHVPYVFPFAKFADLAASSVDLSVVKLDSKLCFLQKLTEEDFKKLLVDKGLDVHGCLGRTPLCIISVNQIDLYQLADKDCDLLCPVCFELIDEAYVTRCGHSFCYACISKAVELHRRCPKCGAALASREHIFPNFLLNEVVARRRAPAAAPPGAPSVRALPEPAPAEPEGEADSRAALRPRGLDAFREDLVAFTRYRALRPLATLSYCSDAINYSTIVSTIEFDKDEEFFAIAGVTKRIKVFEYEAVVRDCVDVHYPCAEMQGSHKISCVSWNAYHKNVLASSDYEGTVSLWALNAERSVATLEAKFNVCCVRFNPRSSCHLAFGSADHCVHYYDLRAPRQPLAVFRDHRKAVSYVQFLDARTLVSASTDSALKLWRVESPRCVRSFTGHANEKNFVGLATDGRYVACGSENNALYVYYAGLSRPLLAYRFDAVRGFLERERRDEEPSEFVSAVCWRRAAPDAHVLLAANSQGTIKVLELV
ncbi:hypothetical protein HW555_009232 [Spodoptera exigua]|uniref:RING-type domain-containing protein n=1 Tax=Spodoptera exigua TaxID=7107 RepID=A0A835G9M9_SPOEX|nr:hypothetical protein HW555_009232 [Spodoptera exigua]